jgi:predicted DsbA family dithiol-disulfide isomerase
MSREPVRLFFDYVDPLSYALTEFLAHSATHGIEDVMWAPFELRPPPLTLLTPDEPALEIHLEEARGILAPLDIPINRPEIVPWTRKAHELSAFAEEKACFQEVHRSLFRAHFIEARDIGRIDVLIDVAWGAGLDRTETKAVLDVDRYLERLLGRRQQATRMGVDGVPTLVVGTEKLDGFSSLEAVLALLSSGTLQGDQGG